MGSYRKVYSGSGSASTTDAVVSTSKAVPLSLSPEVGLRAVGIVRTEAFLFQMMRRPPREGVRQKRTRLLLGG